MLNILIGFRCKIYPFICHKVINKSNIFYPTNKIKRNKFKFHTTVLCTFKSPLCKIIFQNGIELIKKGKSYVAICPFHNEKTPSFYVNDEKNVFHCFGCGKSGNLKSFIREFNKKKDSNNFYNLSAYLDKDIINLNKAQKTLTKYNEQSYLFGFSTLILIQIASNYYEKLVDLNKIAKIYIYTRGVSHLTAKFYKLGYSNFSKETLFKLFCNFYINQEKTIESGLIFKKTGIFYDMFQNRIMIPIFNQKGLIVGFGGRLVTNTRFPRYLNSSDSPIFKKSRCSFSENIFLNINIQKPKIGILVEGYMDSIVLVQNGIRFSLASMGTGISKYHLQRMITLNQNKHILFCFDGDLSGKKAAKKNLLNLSQKIKQRKLKISISVIREFKDPDEFSYFKGGFEFTEEIINTTDPGILWLEKLFYYMHEDLAYFVNYITYEMVVILVKMFNNNTLTRYINLFVKIVLREKIQLKLNVQYFFYQFILNVVKTNKETFIFNKKKKNLKLFKNKSSFDLLGLNKNIKNDCINQKKIFFYSFFAVRIGEDIFYNNIGCFFNFFDFSKYTFQTRQNFQMVNSNNNVFADYWDDIFFLRNFNQILVQNIEDYFMKIFNFNKKKFLEIKTTHILLDFLYREITIELLVKKKSLIVKNFGKIRFLEYFIYIYMYSSKKKSKNFSKKKLKIIKMLKKKKIIIEQTNVHILNNKKIQDN